jgi:hypothetical protein
VLLVALCFRSRVLAGLAAPLIVECPIDFAGPVVLLHQSNAFYEEAARLYRADIATKILVIEKPSTRLEQLGIYRPGELASARLALRGIPPALQAVLPCNDRRAWSFARALQAWLIDHSDSRLILICNRFESRRARFILDRVLAREDRDRVRVVSLKDPLFDESNWWNRKEGATALFNNYVALGYSYLNGDSGTAEADLSPGDYVSLSRSIQ